MPIPQSADVERGGRVGMTLWKAFTWRFGFDSSESRKFLIIVKNKATVDATGYVYDIQLLCYYCQRVVEVWQFGHIYTYRRGVCVARFDNNGQCESLEE